jgi:formylglycine-generating enzyme required for sulfatase activity
MTRPLRVFLCHASQDKPTVWKLHRYLVQYGIKPWLDREDLLPGEDWEVEIPRALFASDVILVCLSKNSVNKEGFVQKEITFALDKAMEKPEGTIFIIPVKLEECEIPKRLTRYQWVDLSRPDGRRRLLMGMNKRVNELGDEVQQIIFDDTRQKKRAFKRADSDQTNRDAVEKAELEAKEKLEREAAAKAELERLEREAKEKTEREAAEKTAREKAEREEAEKAARKSSTAPETKKPEEHIVSATLTEEIKEEPKKEIPAKPFTKLLDPSALSSQGEKQNVRKSVPNNNFRFLGIGSIILLVLIFGGFGLNYLIKNLPVAVATAPFTNDTSAIELSTSTNVPFTSSPQATETPIPVTTLGIGATMIGEKSETLVYVPAGEFTMGDGASDAPIHKVYLDAFWIDQTEVTNKQYKACVDAKTCDPPFSAGSYTHPNYYGDPEFDDYPVIYVNWDKSSRYCEVWTGGDLPTEAQWEKAARGRDARTYPWGEGIDCDRANYYSCVGDTLPVKNYPSGTSPYGAYDMAGNVWEWVNDWYNESSYQILPSSNPLGPNSGQYRVLRGGSWSGGGYGSPSAFRHKDNPANSGSVIGFRCARSASQ